MFKTKRFCLKSTYLTDVRRLSKLLALMSLAMCWAINIGQWLHSLSPSTIEKHSRLSKSIFRCSIVTDLDLKHDRFLHSLKLLSA